MKLRRLVELVIPPQSEAIHLLVEVETMLPREVFLDEEGQHYFYEEHTCPINWIGDVVGIRVGDDVDPHGLAKYVKSVDAPPARGDGPIDDEADWRLVGWVPPRERDE